MTIGRDERIAAIAAETRLRDIVADRFGEAGSTLAELTALSDRRLHEMVSAQETDEISGDNYTDQQLAMLPPLAILGSLGSGNPLQHAMPRTGETVVDLGCGCGADLVLAAQAVGPSGSVLGIDVAVEMSNLSRTVAGFARAKNIRVLHSDFSHVDLPDCFADVVISNNAINLAVNVGDVVREAFRLLKPDGRAVFCEIIAGIELPKSIATDQLAFIGSIAGDLSPLEWQQALYGAGFRDVDLVVDKIYDFHEAIAPVCSMEAMHKAGKKRKELEEQFAGATIMARKPA